MTYPIEALGHGIGLRREHYAELLAGGTAGVDWFEAISENFFEPGGRPRAVLAAVRRDKPVVLHGVALAIGNVDPLDGAYLDRLAALIEEVEPAWVSDHLCFGGAGGVVAHDLLPLPYTEEALAHVVARVGAVQDRLRRRILLENVSSYVTYRASTIPEWEFLAEVARRADCGLLLDVNNVYVSSRNHGFDPAAYLAGVPRDRVGQIHLAGHTDHGWFILDSHIGPVPDPVWSLYADAVARFGAIPTLIEWDEAIPSLAEVVAESARARDIERAALAGGRRVAL